MNQNKTMFSILILIALSAANTACSGFNLQAVVVQPKTIQVKVEKYCPENGAVFLNSFAFNYSSYNTGAGLAADTDRDGLSDQFESNSTIQSLYNISPNLASSNIYGYSDLVVYNAGLTTDQQVSLAQCDDPTLDTDRDGLTDCEESVIGTDRLKPDTDGDGIPDGVEVRYGLNPLVANDAAADTANDGVSNLEKIRRNVPVYMSEASQNPYVPVSYDVTTYIDPVTQNNCYQILVKNMPIINVNNGNEIKLMFLERKNVLGQDPISTVRDVTLIVSKGVLQGQVLEVPDVLNQTICQNANGVIACP